MRPQTQHLKARLRREQSLGEKVGALRNAYPGETCILAATGPSMALYDTRYLHSRLCDSLVISVKQSYLRLAGVADFHLVNLFNYEPYHYVAPTPIVAHLLGPRDASCDLFFPRIMNEGLDRTVAATAAFEEWTLERTLERPWGPGLLHALGFHLAVHVGARKIVTLGWDIGRLGQPTLDHFYGERGVQKPPTIYPGEVAVVAASTGALYDWLLTRGVELEIISRDSPADSRIPRVEL